MENELKQAFQKDGVAHPLPVLTADEVSYYSKQMTEFLEKQNYKLDALNRHKPHLYMKWANDLGRHPKIIEQVSKVLGPDVLLWYSVIFVKQKGTTGYVPWHQDSTYWAMSEQVGLTAWLALSDVNEENGCVNYIPESHKSDFLSHEIDNRADNMLHRGQTIKGFDGSSAKPIILKAGEMSLHDLKLLHSSGPNLSENHRLGIAFRYIPTRNYPRTLKWLKRSATLVNGVDKFKHFATDPVPSSNHDESCIPALKKSMRVAAIHTLFGDDSRSHLRKVLDTIPILISRKTAGYIKNAIAKGRD